MLKPMPNPNRDVRFYVPATADDSLHRATLLQNNVGSFAMSYVMVRYEVEKSTIVGNMHLPAFQRGGFLTGTLR